MNRHEKYFDSKKKKTAEELTYKVSFKHCCFLSLENLHFVRGVFDSPTLSVFSVSEVVSVKFPNNLQMHQKVNDTYVSSPMRCVLPRVSHEE